MRQLIPWSKGDLEYLAEHHGKLSTLEMAEHLGRDAKQVYNKIYNMGLSKKRERPVHTPRPEQKKTIDEAVRLSAAAEEMKKLVSTVDNRALAKGVQAELLETMRALNSGKISAEQALAALSVGHYLMDLPAIPLDVPDVPAVLNQVSQNPSRVIKFDPVSKGFVPPDIGQPTQYVGGVKK